MVEYHVDTIDLYQERMKDTKFGGNLSVRKEANVRALIALGQDKCIFKQYLFRAKAWKINGVRHPMPKDEGYGLMISAFLSRVFGFGMEMTKDDLRRVNEYREEKQYTDQDAAIVINNGRANKAKLTQSPFVATFEYGASAEGYWTYDRMVLQREKIVLTA